MERNLKRCTVLLNKAKLSEIHAEFFDSYNKHKDNFFKKSSFCSYSVITYKNSTSNIPAF